MTKLQVFDPPMCCTSGVCGTNVDTKLVGFLNDVEWLKKQGVEVERYGLAFEPAAFATNEVVKNALKQEGNDSLPLLLVNNTVVYKGGYPDRKKLAEICGIDWKEEYASQEATKSTSNSDVCGPDCDCHQSAISDKAKKLIFATVILLITAILVFKAFCKANAAEINLANESKSKNGIHLIANKAVLGKTINSLKEIDFSGQDAAFVYIPAKNNGGISGETKSAALNAKKALAAKKIKAGLYTLSPSSADYGAASAKAAPPAILVVYKNGGKGGASGSINETSILQAYIAATRDCGAGCPCH